MENIISQERNQIKNFLSHSWALTNQMVGLFSKDTEVVEKVKVVEAEVKEVDRKELLGWGWEVLAVAGLSFVLFSILCIVTLLQLTTGGIL